MVLFGKRYDAMTLWTSNHRWVKALPCSLEQLKYQGSGRPWIERHAKNGRQEGSEEDRATYLAGSTCKYKTQMYHGFFHYKYRLLVSVAKQLCKYGGSQDQVQALMADEEWVEREYNRLEVRLNIGLKTRPGFCVGPTVAVAFSVVVSSIVRGPSTQ